MRSNATDRRGITNQESFREAEGTERDASSLDPEENRTSALPTHLSLSRQRYHEGFSSSTTGDDGHSCKHKRHVTHQGSDLFV